MISADTESKQKKSEAAGL